MKIFFYFPILLIALTYLYIAFNKNSAYKKLHYYIRRNKKDGLNLTDAGKQAFNNLSENEKYSMIYFIGCALLSIFFSLVGLFSFNWPIFLFLIVWGLTLSNILIKYRLFRISFLVTGLLQLFACVNSYHLKINIYEFLINIL